MSYDISSGSITETQRVEWVHVFAYSSYFAYSSRNIFSTANCVLEKPVVSIVDRYSFTLVEVEVPVPASASLVLDVSSRKRKNHPRRIAAVTMIRAIMLCFISSKVYYRNSVRRF